MKARTFLALAAAVLLGVFGSQWLGRGPDPAGRPAVGAAPSEAVAATGPPGAAGPAAEAPTTAPALPPAPAGSDAGLVVRDVLVRDVDGRVAWRGDVHLAPVLERIASGGRDAHRNDGGIFGNREGLLPARPRGYYREYVVRTPGLSHAGPQRLVLGSGGEVYYTRDHYASFVRIR